MLKSSVFESKGFPKLKRKKYLILELYIIAGSHMKEKFYYRTLSLAPL